MPMTIDRRFSIAPMMACTDRFYRFFARLLTRRALLYTEMLTANAVLRGDRERLLGHDAAEHPLALQVGGAEPDAMAEAARVAAALGYDEININVGCPSDRVQAGRFGACLMAEPDTVAACVVAMRRAAPIPVTVKTRIGIDARDSYEHLADFVGRVAGAGCAVFIVHARKAWLSGLSPKQNREIPPLDYDSVYRLAGDFPHLAFVLNGGIKSIDDAVPHIGRLAGTMIGRAAYETPYILAEADRRIYAAAAAPATRGEVVAAYLPFLERQRRRGVPLGPLVKPLIGLFHGEAGGRLWRRHLAENAHRPGAGPETIARALAIVQGARTPERAAA